MLKSKTMKIAIISAFAMFSNVTVFAGTALDFVSQMGTLTYSGWNLTGGEIVENGKNFKSAIVNIGDNGNNYVVLESCSNAQGSDPVLYYNNGGSWSILADDESVNSNYKVILHFTGSVTRGLTLGFAHWNSWDNGFYYHTQNFYNYEPYLPGIKVYSVNSSGVVQLEKTIQ